MDRQTKERMEEWKGGQKEGQKGGRKDQRMEEGKDGWKGGQKELWAEQTERNDGWTE